MAHVDVRGVVVDDLGFPLGQARLDRVAVGDVGLEQARVAVDELALAGREVVERGDFVAELDQAVYHV